MLSTGTETPRTLYCRSNILPVLGIIFINSVILASFCVCEILLSFSHIQCRQDVLLEKSR